MSSPKAPRREPDTAKRILEGRQVLCVWRAELSKGIGPYRSLFSVYYALTS